MDRSFILSLAIVAAFIVIPLTLYFVLPDPAPPENAPSAEEAEAVRRLIAGTEELFPYLTYTRVRTTDQRVVIIEARWTGDNPPERGKPDAWNAAAEDIARVISDEYLPSGWQVNVLLFRTRWQLMGIAARPSALDGPEGWLRPEARQQDSSTQPAAPEPAGAGTAEPEPALP